MAFTPDDIYKLFIVKRTQVEMLTDRNFLIPDDEITMFLEHPDALRPSGDLLAQFVQRYTPEEGKIFSREELTTTYYDEDGHSTHVYFSPPTAKDKQGVGVVNTFIDALTELNVETGIIITNEGFTPDAKKQLEVLTSPKIQIFFDYQLYANPTKHVLVPKHTRVSDEDRRELLTKYRLQPRQIIVTSIDDPIIRYYGWNIGDLIKVERVNLATNKTMVKTSIVYRMVSRMKFDVEKKVSKNK